MADVAATNVTILSEWSEGSPNGRRHTAIRAKWTSVTAGGGTNKIPASAFGLSEIFDCSPVLLDAATKKIYPAQPSSDGSQILTSNPDEAVDANRANAADIAPGGNFAFITLRGRR